MPYTPKGILYKLVLYPLAKIYWLTFRPHVLEVRCVVEHEGRLLLIRHTYGSMEWDLPGGGTKGSETPEDAAAREVYEEVGITLSGLRQAVVLRAGEDGRRVGTVVFCARAVGPELRPRRAEIYDEGWFDWDRLPRQLSPAARRIIALYRSGALPSDPDATPQRGPDRGPGRAGGAPHGGGERAPSGPPRDDSGRASSRPGENGA